MPKEIAYVFQENALFPWNTVIENIKLGMLFQGVPKPEHEPRARQSLEAVGPRPNSPSTIRASSPAACASARRSRARSASRPAWC